MPTNLLEQSLYFDTPYRGTVELATVTARISKTESLFIRAIRPEQRTVTSILGHLWKKLAHELLSRNITDASRCDDLVRFVTTCHLISATEYEEYQRLRNGGLPNSSSSGPLSSTVPPNDSGGTTSVRGAHSTDETKPTDVQGRNRGKRKGAGGGEKSEEGKTTITS